MWKELCFVFPGWLTLIPCPKTAYSVSELTPSGTLACAESIPQLGFPVKSGASVDPMPEKPQSLSPVTLVACPTEQPEPQAPAGCSSKQPQSLMSPENRIRPAFLEFFILPA